MRICSLFITASFGLATASPGALAGCNSLLQQTTPADRYVTQSNATVVDTETGLMWKRCAQGFVWEGTTCTEDPATAASYSWSDALASGASHQFAGHGDWRLPNKIELASIVEYSCFEPAINSAIFPSTPVNSFWTNTPNYFNISFAWAVNFAQGEHTTTRRSNMFGVRLVRDFKTE